MTQKRNINRTAICAALALAAMGCKKELQPVDVEITDPIRHYYPVVQGEQLAVTYEIENISDQPLVIQEIQTTCGCILPKDELPMVILPDKTGRIRLNYDTTKNTGEVEHYVWVYGNFTDSIWREMHFTTNVVPPADYTRDYEMIYQEKVTGIATAIKDFVDGKSSEKGYYTDTGEDTRARQNEARQRSVNDRPAF